MPWKSFLKDYFNFSRAERYGILVLCGCIVVVLAVRWLLPHLGNNQAPDTAAYEKEIAQFRRSADSLRAAKDQTVVALEHAQQPLPGLFYFDPNLATDENWKKLGLNDRQIRNIRNYQAKGGHFRRKEDLQKLYTIPATQYQLLESYIRIAGNEPAAKPATSEHSSGTKPAANVSTENVAATLPGKKLLQVELNSADSSLLTQLHGIGPVLAARTIKYRNRIGGFANVAQLGEVYGVKPELVEQLMPQLSADRSLIRKITINTASFKELVSHPYLNEQQVKGILNYKKLQGHINGLNELVRNNILTDEEAGKIEPYMAFD